MRNSEKMRFFSKQSGSSEDESVDLNSNKESWFHLVLTKSSSKEIKIYVNATLIDTLQLSNWSMNFLRVGTNRNTTNTWIGNLDDVRIYDYVLDSKDINKLYHNY